MVAEVNPWGDKGKHTRDRSVPCQHGKGGYPLWQVMARGVTPCDRLPPVAGGRDQSLPMALSTQLTRRMMNREIDPMMRKMAIGVA